MNPIEKLIGDYQPMSHLLDRTTTLPKYESLRDQLLSHCQPAFITFENGKTAKFYDLSLRNIVLLQRWTFVSQLIPQP